MKKSWNLIEKICLGEKTIESRWYVLRCAPWNKIAGGDTIYFKDSGGPVTLQAKVVKVLQFDNLDYEKTKEILEKYGEKIGTRYIPHFEKSLEGKKYCILAFLKDVKKVKPFFINKSGFGVSAAWLVIENIKKIIAKETI